MSSGTSSPAPGGEAGQQSTAGPSPLTIGKRFVKQYYQVLSSTPDQIYRFYQPASVLSDGEGSSPTEPATFESTYDGSSEKLKDRFFVKDLQIRFEFEHGAIDAQQSVNGGLLLVVTGHVVYFPSASEDEDAAVDDPIRKAFVHTFFLNALASGTKKSFYVHNDILRFLKNPSEVNASISEAAEIEKEPLAVPSKERTAEPLPETKTKITPSPSLAKKQTQQPAAEIKKSTDTATISKETVSEEAPGGGVEETKDDLPPVETIAPAQPSGDETGGKMGGKGGKNDGASAAKDGTKGKEDKITSQNKGKEDKDGDKSRVPPSSPAPKPALGSWASLVAGAGGGTGPASPSAVKTPAVVAKTVPKPAPTVAQNKKAANDKKDKSAAANSDNSAHVSSVMRSDRTVKRDPDCTLVIKNLADGTKESDVLALFEPFAAQTKTKIVGITVSGHRGIAFVDYDSVNPVMKAVELHQKEPMHLGGRVLEVDQKTAEQRARRAAQQRGGGGGGGGGGGAGGNLRSGSPNNRGGGRGGNRRRDGGKGDRGGGGTGGRGGRF